MHILEIIEKKKKGRTLTLSEIAYFVSGYTQGDIPDYQAAALMMAICLKGMDDAETVHLTHAMVDSGERMDLSGIAGIPVDKHSTGGVADTTTLIAAPLAAACGVPVAKMSGKGLGHTGGTLDKLLSIPGMRVEFSAREMVNLVEKNALAVVGQSTGLVPADRKLYALRDVTATIDSAPLIASSIMSKKIAAGCKGLVLDVKVGSGAFNATVDEARKLARTMTALGRQAGLATTALITDMNQPLGRRIGNGLEVREAIEVLNGRHSNGRLRAVAMTLAAEMLVLGGAVLSIDAARPMLEKALDDGRGMEKLLAMVLAQGGDASALLHPESLWPVKTIVDIPAPRDGFITAMDTRAIGRAACLLGAGRQKKGDMIDPAVGITLACELGDAVRRGDSLAQFHVNADNKLEEALRIFTDAIIMGEEFSAAPPVIYERST